MDTLQESLLRAIGLATSDQDESAPCAAYADWLQEQGDERFTAMQRSRHRRRPILPGDHYSQAWVESIAKQEQLPWSFYHQSLMMRGWLHQRMSIEELHAWRQRNPSPTWPIEMSVMIHREQDLETLGWVLQSPLPPWVRLGLELPSILTSDYALPRLAAIPNLISLRVGANFASSEYPADWLPIWPRLRRLAMASQHLLSQAMIQHWATLPALEQITLTGWSELSPTTWAAFGQIPQLTEIRAKSTQLWDLKTLKSWTRNGRWAVLDLRQFVPLTRPMHDSLARLTQLTELTLTQADLVNLSPEVNRLWNRSLERLNITGPADSRLAGCLKRFCPGSRLQHLTIEDASSLSDLDFVPIAELDQLRELRIGYGWRLTRESLMRLIDRRGLSSIGLSHCPKISHHARSAFRRARPDCVLGV